MGRHQHWKDSIPIHQHVTVQPCFLRHSRSMTLNLPENYQLSFVLLSYQVHLSGNLNFHFLKDSKHLANILG